MQTFADIVFPTAVRHPFTYSIPDYLADDVRPGVRVWVPFQKHMAIGMVVNVRTEQPDFETRPIEKALDEEPILEEELLELTEWIHRFYYCGWGEVIQAALPVGLNFYSEKYVKPGKDNRGQSISKEGRRILESIKTEGPFVYDEAMRKWSDPDSRKAIKKLLNDGILEIWEEPKLKMAPQRKKVWKWRAGTTPGEAIALIDEYDKEGKSYKWIRALELLVELNLPEYQEELTRFDLLDYYTLNRIAEEDLIQAEEVEAYDLGLKYEYDPKQLVELNEEQKRAFNEIKEKIDREKFGSFLLYGVTGSGKTEVYIHLLKKILEKDKGGLVLVPEIGLTTQIIQRFYKIFGDQIAVLHSRLTDRERYDAWHALKKGDKKIAIGTRSAVYAPVRNLGIIVVDEEHDTSFKQQDPAPRYHTRETAIMRARNNEAIIVMGSATPSMVALQGTRKGKSTLLSLSKRPLEARLPDVSVLDLKQYRSAMKGPLAAPLYNAVREALDRDEQAILLYNRRGYAYFLQCAECGFIPECPNCSVSLTYHKKKNQLRCHYCGYATGASKECGSCRGTLEAIGSGTQQLEEEIETLFSDKEVIRMDFDSTSGRNAHLRMLNRFSRKKAHILVGTQIVGKGLDFPDVTVVGVIYADTELAFPSFRSSERLFQLLSQVAGRSGRSSKEGKVFFQTWQPEHPAIQAARKHHYKAFAKRELSYRKKLQYPPFSRLIRCAFKGKKDRMVRKVSEIFTSCLKEVLGEGSVLGPSPAAIARMQQFYRWETLVKISPNAGAEAIERILDRSFEKFEARKPHGSSKVRINVNVDAME